MVLHDGKQSLIKRIGQYNQRLFDNIIWSEHMLKVGETRFVPVYLCGNAYTVNHRLTNYVTIKIN